MIDRKEIENAAIIIEQLVALNDAKKLPVSFPADVMKIANLMKDVLCWVDKHPHPTVTEKVIEDIEGLFKEMGIKIVVTSGGTGAPMHHTGEGGLA